MTIFGVTISDELASSVILGVLIPLGLKIIERFFPWLTINGAGSHTKQADKDETKRAEEDES